MQKERSTRTLQRQELIDALDSSINSESEAHCVLAIIDIRDFRELNHSFGIACGDAILESIDQRLRERKLDKTSHYYLGNDEYAILFSDPLSAGIALVQIEHLLDIFKQPFSYKDSNNDQHHSIKVTVNCGVAINFSQHASPSQLLFDSEVALKQAKKNNRPYVWLEKEEQQTSSRSKWHLLNSLHSAIEEQELSLYWQPKVPLYPKERRAVADRRSTKRFLESGDPNSTANESQKARTPHCGAEALIRWETPDQGVLAPKITLPLIEHLGSEIELIEWMLNMALRQLSIADERLTDTSKNALVQPGALTTSASINIPPSLDTIQALDQLVADALSIWGIAPGRLTLEITEETLIRDKQKVFDGLNRVRDQGVRISIDDFGTGYSSLAYFKHIPADELKIDQSFIHAMQHSDADRKMVNLIIDIAHTFGLTVVAEGVEDQDTADLLRNMGCDYAQGFLYSKPVPHRDYLDWIDKNKTRYL